MLMRRCGPGNWFRSSWPGARVFIAYREARVVVRGYGYAEDVVVPQVQFFR